MKKTKLKKIGIAMVLVMVFIVCSIRIIKAVDPAIKPDLGSADSFSVLASLAMSATVPAPGTVVSGDLGLSTNLASSRTGNWTVLGTEYFGPLSLAKTARDDALLAFNDLAAQASHGVWSLDPNPIPGVWTTAVSSVFAGTLTLNGDYNDVWIFQIGTDFTFTGQIVMTGNAQPCNVFWQVGRDATIASGSSFMGTLIAGRDITLVSGATVDGRILSLDGALTTDNNNISGPTCTPPPPVPATLNVIKTVINDNGGILESPDFSFSVNGEPAQSFEVDGQNDLTLPAGTYTISEPPVSNYTTTYENCSDLILLSGDLGTCTITNNDIAPTLHVIKTVINNDGGLLVASDFTINTTGINVSTASFSGEEDPGTTVTLDAGLYIIDENYVSGYNKTLSPDCLGVINIGETKTCTITNDDIALPPPELATLKVIKKVINDNEGTLLSSDFIMDVTGTNVSQAFFPGEDEPGTTVTLDAGAYNVYEDFVPRYTNSFSPDCTGTILAGETKICTITNNDVVPPLPTVRQSVSSGSSIVSLYSVLLPVQAATKVIIPAVLNTITPRFPNTGFSSDNRDVPFRLIGFILLFIF